MLCLDYLQPSLHGQPLAIVRYRLARGETLSSVGLVRCPPEVVAKFPNWSPRTKAHLKPYRHGQHPRAKLVLPEVDSFRESTWREHGLEVIEYRQLWGYPRQREYDHQNCGSFMTELLQHPVWVSTGMEWSLKSASAAPHAPRKRL